MAACSESVRSLVRERAGYPGEETLREAFVRVLRACDHQGLQRADAEDLAQDLFLWLVAHPERAPLLTGAGLGSAIRIYLMRYRRRTHTRRMREAPAVDFEIDARGSSRPHADEITVSVGALERLLPGAEARVLKQLKAGATWAEAVAAAGVPPGSRDWLRKRMAGHVRTAFKPSTRFSAARGR
jgi:hypothetical protein